MAERQDLYNEQIHSILTTNRSNRGWALTTRPFPCSFLYTPYRNFPIRQSHQPHCYTPHAVYQWVCSRSVVQSCCSVTRRNIALTSDDQQRSECFRAHDSIAGVCRTQGGGRAWVDLECHDVSHFTKHGKNNIQHTLWAIREVIRRGSQVCCTKVGVFNPLDRA